MGRIVQTQNCFWTIFQYFFIRMSPGPTHPLPIFFGIFGMFLTLQIPLAHVGTRAMRRMICNRFVWSGMDRDIRLLVRAPRTVIHVKRAKRFDHMC